MTFAAAVQWFEDWQLRLLVLASLFFQYFLFATAIVRKRRVPHWFRALIWLAYQGGDVVAIYALATLFSQHRDQILATNPATAHHLDTLWAPILLLHLGGQDGITAYSIEDNENWRRYLLVSVCQITIAIYVFRKSWWSGDLLLLRAAILLFVPGILKCLEKPWALKNATVTSIINSSDQRLERTLDEDDELHKDVYSQEDYVKAAADTVVRYEPKALELFEHEVADQPFHLLVDLGHPYAIRLRNLQLLAPRVARADVHGLVRSSLSMAFDRVYTKHLASFGGLLRAAVVLLTFVDIGVFQRSHRRASYARADVIVTYVLLSCTAALEFVSACLVLGSGLPPPDDQLAQYNLVGYLARNENHPRFWSLAGLLGARLQLDRLWCTAPRAPSLGVTRLVYDHVAAGWKDYIGKALYEYDATGGGRWRLKPTLTDGVRAYRLFNDSRGQRTLEREGCVGRMSAIKESLRMPFDESVLLWHLATEFCYFDHVDTGNDPTRHSRMVSNYMAYLLFVKPEMLIAGARSKLFRATYRELRKMLKPPPEDEEAIELEPTEKKAPPPKSKNEMVRKVIQKVKSTIGLGSEDLVYKAWAVTHELKEFAKQKKQEFITELQKREENRKKLIEVLRWAKEKADGFIDVKNNKRDEVLNKLMEVMDSAQKKANEFINVKSNKAEFINHIKEAMENAELLIKQEKKQTKVEERITYLLQCAKSKEEEFIKNEEAKTNLPADIEVLIVKGFSVNVGEVIQLAKDETKKLMDGKTEAKVKAEEFINGANNFINEEKKKKQTKEEEKITELLESAVKKAGEFVKSEQKVAAEPSWKLKVAEEEKLVAAVKEFSEKAGEAIKLVEEEVEKPKDLMGRNLIARTDELRMIRAKENADDKMWAVIQGVWVEMLCFSAGRCRGYLHAKSLGNGGEYLSYVWLLMSYMGMETMPERMQRPELPTVGDTGAQVKTPSDEDMDDDEPAQRRISAAARRQWASATPQPQAGATSSAQPAPQQQQRLVAMPVPAMSATVVPLGEDIV